MIQLFTIGYTHKSAEKFFSLLSLNNIKNLIDIRLNNNSQFAGFTKKDDLGYFLKNISQIHYTYCPFLAPTKELLEAYRKKLIDWNEYVIQFTALMKDRKIENKIDLKILHMGCLLCSEEFADKCHRRLAAEYLRDHFSEISIIHI